MKASKIKTLFECLQKHNPKPTIELHYKSPFELLIAVLLSAQATDVGVNKATALLFRVANTPETLLALGEDGLKTYIKTINLYPTKARHIIRLCDALIKKHHGLVPSERAALEALPGIGRKSANVMLNTVFGEITIAVDTHIFRVANRTGLAPGKNVLAVEKKLMTVVPKAFQRNAHHWLVLHGRHICTARKPRCSSCPIAMVCEYPSKKICTLSG